MRWAKYGMLSGGPDWMRTEKFTLQAKMPDGFPRYTFRQFVDGQAPRLRSMLQSLLETRFKLIFHREKKEVPLYELGPGKNGVKLDWNGHSDTEGIRLTKAGDCEDVDPLTMLSRDTPATRTFCGSRFLTFAGSPPHSWLLMMTGATSVQLASMLELSLERPVVDRTGIG